MHSATTIPFVPPPKPLPAPIIEPLLTLDQVAEVLNFSRRTAERVAASGELRTVKIGANVRVDPRDLRDFIDHYSESDLKLRAFDVNQLEPLLRTTMRPTVEQILATRDPLLEGVVFPAEVVDEVTEFMRALTDPRARDLHRLTPRRVPSGLPVD